MNQKRIFTIIRSAGFIYLALFFSACRLFTVVSTPSRNHSQWVSLDVVGDVMAHNEQLESAYDPSCDCYKFDSVFSEVKSDLSSADLTIGNLETTLPGKKSLYSGYPQFGSPDALPEALKKIGFDILANANNHSVDKGKAGILRTIEVLDRLQMHHLGTYSSEEEFKKNRVLIVNVKGLRLAFLNYTYGTNGIAVPDGVRVNLIDPVAIKEDLKLARKKKPDAIVVLYHFGNEYERLPNQFQKEMTQLAFMEGADVVLGGHPHVLQPFEVKDMTDNYGENKKRLVIYSLGNFLSNQQGRYTDGGIIFKFRIRKVRSGPGLDFSDVHFDPVWVYVENAPQTTSDRSHSMTGNNANVQNSASAQAQVRSPYRYHIIPVRQFLNAGKLQTLPEPAQKRMLRFYDDTVEHLGPSLKAMKEEGLYTGTVGMKDD